MSSSRSVQETSAASPSGTATSVRTLRLASTLAFVLAAMVNDTLHELAHAVAGLVLGLTPTVMPFAVDFAPEGTSSQQVVTALAGPLFSLLLGLALIGLTRHRGAGVGRLFWTWLGGMAVMNFAGYLFIAPFAHVGDTGQALGLLGAPGWVFALVCVVGALVQLALARHFAREVQRYARDLDDQRALAFQPWLLGTAAVVVLTVAQTVLLDAPAEIAVVVIIYSVAIGVFAPMQFLFNRRVSAPYEGLVVGRLRVPLALVLLLAAALLVLAAVGGLTLG
jgi:hypothetical protein